MLVASLAVVEVLLARLDGFLTFSHKKLDGFMVTPGELKAALI